MIDQAPAVEVRHLYKVFGDHPKRALEMLERGVSKAAIFERTGMTIGVEDASFSVSPGEIFVVMGLSGSGKSTLLRMLNRLIQPSSGQVLIEGQDITGLSERDLIDVRRKKMSMVFQSFALLPHLKVWENVAFGLEIAGVEKQKRRARALDVLEQVGLKAQAESYPPQLSGGMQQRVGLARALCTEPAVLLMDEAFSALDPLIRSEMQDELVRLQRQHSRTIVFISHDLDEAMRIGDRILILEAGRIVQLGTPHEILDNPANDFVRSFFRNVDVAKFYRAGDVATRHDELVIDAAESDVAALLEQLVQAERDVAYLRAPSGAFTGLVTEQRLRAALAAGHDLDSALLDVTKLDATEPLGDVVAQVADSRYALPVLDETGRLTGVLSKRELL
ncbi:MAG: glycine betaine/L-proline ABC transporter ATP-binding protein ProV, partial [Myxococcales bacterium]|nr:glycine betaine/L-proline ABC transporter ATP-binding protein ProV [Myxococcales bacterium]